MNADVRPATAADAGAIAHVHHSARAEAYGPAYADHGRVDPRCALVAEHAGVLVGFAATEGGLLRSLYVLPGARDAGAGTVLLGAAVDAGARELWVYADNAGARRFYERWGWVAEPDSLHTGEGWAPAKPALRYRLDVGIRAAVPADAAGLSDLHRAARRAAYAHLGTPAQCDGQFTPAWWRAAIEGPDTALVAERNGEPVGLALVEGELLGQLYVAPERTGGGLGARLLRAAEAAGARELWVYADNPRARHFYARHGWQPVPGSTRVDPAWAIPAPALAYRRDDDG